MARFHQKGAEQARSQLPSLLDDAQQGRITVITRRGRSIAAIVPVAAIASVRQLPLGPMEGSGKGLWGPDIARTIRRLRGEWKR